MNYVKAIFERYPQLEKAEIWNEPNAAGFWDNGTGQITATDAANYALLVKETSQAIKVTRPDVDIHAGSIDVSKSPITYINNMLAEGVYPYMDTLSYHPYYHPNNVNTENKDGYVDSRITPYKNAMRNAGGFKKLSATEFGFSTDMLFPGTGEAVKSREVPKVVIVSAANNIDMGNQFNYQDSNESFGMIDANGVPNPLMYSMAQLNNALHQSMFLGQLPTDTRVRSYVFVKNNKPLIVAWATESMNLSVTGANLKAYDQSGNPITLTGQNVPLNLNPVYIEGADLAYLASAKDFEVERRTQFILDYFTSLPTAVRTAVESGASDVKAVVMNSDMTDKQKSAMLDMIYEIEVVEAVYAAVTGAQKTTLPTAQYAQLKASSGTNAYAAAALKYADDYIKAGEKMIAQDAPASMLTKNIIIAEKLLESAAYLLNEANALTVSNVQVTNGTLTFNVDNPESLSVDIYVACYDESKLLSVELRHNTSNLSFDVGNAHGRIFIWNSATMKPLTGGTEF